MQAEYGGIPFLKNMLYRMRDLERYAGEPQDVVDAVEKALTDKKPPKRLAIGPWTQLIYLNFPSFFFDRLSKYFYMQHVKPLSKL